MHHKESRDLSAIVGTVFLVAVVIGALSYVTYSMNILRNFFESLITEEKRQKEKQSEVFEITSVEITPSDKLDGEYGMFVFINGYDEEGSTFLRNLEMGRVKVQD